jgi:hypothetical protein
MYLHFGILLAATLGIAFGLFYRLSIITFFLGFTYLELIDLSNYLNHYYLISLLALLMVFMPLNRLWSLDGRRNPELRQARLPVWCLYLIRFQVGVVYVFAGLAKLGSDWLLHAQPLGIWLTSHSSLPLIGPFLAQSWVHYFMSWAGFIFDSSIVWFMLWHRSRPFAYLVIIIFHFFTHIFFSIGMFPFIMVTVTTIFFSPSWPRYWLNRLRRRLAAKTLDAPKPLVLTTDAAPQPMGRPFKLMLIGSYCLLQVLLPLRHILYPGSVLWNEEGMRFAWKVMVREKNSSLTYFVRQKASGRIWQVTPGRYLNLDQEREMATQPDMILQLAHHIARDFRNQGLGEVEVRAEALVSLNGRSPKKLIDPTVDLTQVRDGLSPKSWILPPPVSQPVALSGRDSR